MSHWHLVDGCWIVVAVFTALSFSFAVALAVLGPLSFAVFGTLSFSLWGRRLDQVHDALAFATIQCWRLRLLL